ncbi:hypothetical protein EDD80_102158 [Anseongella ginsenosidimutans]|uniref:Uncharacterized protein n=1 Tax=Anseongella ginsenosidimutans TaxID=496056 RepID=A0A4R3KUA4_9SPHI|nr:DUF6580 family putative transport protein [Anseongella ginsenosidimutans]QEC51634.1 hypothetical protein FRZ59_04225 [Anseongella ginsenosidimutans]TCS88967.1 hypothetical protein EDD80_102158 [Anseongella ginsenosidimutans]
MEKISSNNRTGVIVLSGIILTAALSRIIPHGWNFTPVGAMALFGSAYYASRWMAFLVPLASLWISDVVLNNTIHAAYTEGFSLFHSSMIGVYLAFIAVTLTGILLLRKVRVTSVLLAAVAGAVVFWLIVDFASWMWDPLYRTLYPGSLSGLLACYAAGFPFFLKMLLGNLVYSALLFGVFELLRRRVPVLAPATR